MPTPSTNPTPEGHPPQIAAAFGQKPAAQTVAVIAPGVDATAADRFAPAAVPAPQTAAVETAPAARPIPHPMPPETLPAGVAADRATAEYEGKRIVAQEQQRRQEIERGHDRFRRFLGQTPQASVVGMAGPNSQPAPAGALPTGREMNLADCIGLVSRINQSVFKQPDQPLENCQPSPELQDLAKKLKHVSSQLEEVAIARQDIDRRWHTLHLLVEELAEFTDALACVDELRATDAAADLQYVVLNACGRHRIPMAPAFFEVCRSNATKTAQPDDPAAMRVRMKGPNYRPPRLAEVFALHKSRMPLAPKMQKAFD
jgi:NTP pyrophosphatase (non-canonical NTP hydrolase)